MKLLPPKTLTVALWAFLMVFNAAVVASWPAAQFNIELPSFAGRWHSQVAIPSSEEMWRTILRHKAKATIAARDLIQKARNEYADVASTIDEYKRHMEDTVKAASQAREKLDVALSAHGISLEDLSEMLATELEQLEDALKKEFEEPLPEDQDERYLQRQKMLNFTLEKIEDAFAKTVAVADIPEDEARRTFLPVRATLHRTLSVAGNIIDRHPVLVETIVISAVFLLIPQSWVLGPIMRVFGFGTRGPVRGSAAAWLQRFFWGGSVAKGSWFAALQQAGMVGGGGAWKVIVAIGAAAAFLVRGCR